MSKPTDIITWATDAAYAADGDAWGGDANKADPGATRRAEGAEPDTFPSVWFNHILNAIGNVLTWLLARFDPLGQVVLESAVGFSRYRQADSSKILNGTWTSYSGTCKAQSNKAQLAFDITDMLPRNSRLTSVKVLVQPGIARATTADRIQMFFSYFKYGVNFSTPVYTGISVGVVNDDGTGNLQWIILDLSASPIDIWSGPTWSVEVTAGADAGAHWDNIHAVQVEFETALITND